MSYPQFNPREQQVRLQIDLNQSTFQAYLNCINSFQGLETESEMRSAGGTSISTMTSKVSMERFIYNIGVLDGIIGRKDHPTAKWEAGEYSPADENFNPFNYWAALVQWLKDVGFFRNAGVIELD